MSRYHNFEDWELFRSLQMGENAVFNEIFDRYWGKLLDAAYQRLKSREAAEDVVQEVFVNLFVRARQIVLKSTLEAYLRTALKYKVIDAYRIQQRHYKYMDDLVANIPPNTRPQQEIEIRELREKVYTVAGKLPEKCREVFLLSRFGELSHQEIAAQMNISVVTVKSHLNKAMKVFRKEFGDNRFELLAIGLLVLFK